MAIVTNERRQGVNSGKAIKIPVYAATTANITLSGEQTIDNVSVTEDMRVLVKNQTNAVQNGIYEVSTGSWTRALDFDGKLDTTEGTIVLVLYGSTNGNSFWRLTTPNATIGTSALSFMQALFTDSSGISFLQDGTGAVPRSAQSKMRERISVDDFGALGDDSTDDYAAIQAAIDALQPGQTLCSTAGKKYRVSQTLLWQDKFRTICDFQGELRPHGSFNDYLIEFAGTISDPNYVNVALSITVLNMKINGLLQSRGMKVSGIYISGFHNLHFNKCYGTALRIGHGFESQYYNVVATLCKERSVSWLSDATAWDAGTAYVENDRVYRDPGAWSAVTTYTQNQLVSKSSKCFRSLEPANLNNDPETSPSWWQEVDFEYYLCRIDNTNKDPWSASFYTTNSGTAGNRYWQYTPPFEAILHIENDDENGRIFDVTHFFGVKIRDSTSRVYLYVDTNYGNRQIYDVGFFGCQFHACIAGIVAALPALGALPSRPIMGLFGRVDQLGFHQTHFRSAQGDDAICVQLGMHDPSKTCTNPKINGLIVSGEGDRATGIYAANASNCAIPAVHLDMTTGTDVRDVSDPNHVLYNASESITRRALVRRDSNQTIADDTSTAVSWEVATYDTGNFWSAADPTKLVIPTGCTKVRLTANVSYNANNTGIRLSRFGINTVTNFVGNAVVKALNNGAGQSVDNCLCSAVINVTAGQEIELYVYQNSGGNLDILYGVNALWMAIEQIQ